MPDRAALAGLRAQLVDELASLEPPYSPLREVQDQLMHFLELLLKWNRVYNLTAVRDPQEMIKRHLVDSLSVLPWMPAEPVGDSAKASPEGLFDVLDVGTGAGLPVLPLAMVRPDLAFLSVESSGKKTRFQQQVVLETGLANVTIANARIQDVDQSAQTVISRAFTAPVAFLSLVEPVCTDGGRVIVMLGHKERLPEALPASFTLERVHRVRLPGLEQAGAELTRHVAICHKSCPQSG